MKAEVIRASALTARDIEAWHSMQAGNPGLQSPFFGPEFAMAVGAERDDAFVAVLSHGGCAEGFLAFHRDASGTGKPIGLRISDYHGIVAPESPSYEAAELLRVCGLSRWDFRNVPDSQKIFEPWKTAALPTVSIDLLEGFGRYHSGSRLQKRLENLRRRAERQQGALKFTWHSANPSDFHALLACKSAQYRRTLIADVFEAPWIANMLEHLHRGRAPGCRGVLSQLHAGEQLMASHFGLRSSSVLHYWFPCYQPAFAQYSPGLMLLMEIARHAACEGITRIDLGFGKAGYKAGYKERFANAAGTVLRGSVVVPRAECATDL